jgi:hypothetical protein
MITHTQQSIMILVKKALDDHFAGQSITDVTVMQANQSVPTNKRGYLCTFFSVQNPKTSGGAKEIISDTPEGLTIKHTSQYKQEIQIDCVGLSAGLNGVDLAAQAQLAFTTERTGDLFRDSNIIVGTPGNVMMRYTQDDQGRYQQIGTISIFLLYNQSIDEFIKRVVSVKGDIHAYPKG